MTPALFVPVLGRKLYPGASVALDFTRNLYRSGTPVVKGSPSLLSGWTFTRASTGYAETAAGALAAFASGAPRITDKGLLVEEARTNLLLRSQEFDNASWTAGNVTISANAAVAPDGTTTADRMTSTGFANVYQHAVVAATSCTLTCYVKKGSAANQANRFGIRNHTTATDLVFVRIDLDTGAITYTTGASGGSSTAMGNGWWRVVITVSTGITSGDTITSYVGFVGTATSGQYADFWGAQLEAGAFPTSYIPTTTASATRAADDAALSIALPATPTLVASVLWVDLTTTRTVLSWNDGTVSNRVELYLSTAEAGSAFAASGGATQINAGAATTGGRAKIAMCFDGADYRGSANGGTITAATGKIAPVGANSLNIGRFNATQYFNNYIERIVVYPLPQTQAQLNALTT